MAIAFLRNSNTIEAGMTVPGAGVFLRIPQMADFESWAELRAASRDFLTPWEPTWPVDDLTRSAFRRRVKRYQRDVRDDCAYPFFLYRSNDNMLLGGLTLSNVRRGVTQSCSLGYWIGQPHAGKGLMAAGVRAVAPFVFGTLRLHRLEAACIPTNLPSIRLLQRVGFTQEGMARSYLRINGKWQDHLLFALLEGDLRG